MPYTTRQAATRAAISPATVRLYAAKYKAHLSAGAKPPAGEPRLFTEADVRLLRFVYERTTTAGEPHSKVKEALATGELDRFDWQPKSEPETERRTVMLEPEDGEPETALVPVAQLRAVAALLEDARQREEEATSRAEELQSRLDATLLELGEARGKLSERRRYKAPAWLRALFGSSEPG